VKSAIGLIVIEICLLAMTPIIVQQVQAINTSNWTFTGAEGAKALIGLVPFAWVGGVLLAGVVGAFSLAKTGKSNMIERTLPYFQKASIKTVQTFRYIKSKAINRMAMIYARL